MSATALLAPTDRYCRCGHVLEAHRHYRPGSDCGLCGCARVTPRQPRARAGLAFGLGRGALHPTDLPRTLWRTLHRPPPADPTR